MFLGITWCSRIIILPKLRIASRQNTPDSTEHNRERTQIVNVSYPTTQDPPAHARDATAQTNDSTAHVYERIAQAHDSIAHVRDCVARHHDSMTHMRGCTARPLGRIARTF